MEKRHTGELCEALCCLVDGEAEPSEAQFMLRRLGHDEELAARWERYHMVRSVLRDRRGGVLSGFAARVSAQVAQEPAPESASPREQPAALTKPRRWLQPAAGVAVAASVAVLAFNAWQPQTTGLPAESAGPQTLLTQGVDDPTADVEGRVGPAASSLAIPAAVGAKTDLPGQSRNERLQRYLIRHTQVSATGHRLPLIYVVSETTDVDTAGDSAETQASAPGEP